jgi:PAS domain S-box-containing protein
VKPKPGNRKKLLIESLAQPIAPLCVTLLSLGLTGLAWYYAANSVKRDVQSKFERQVSESTSALKFRLQTYINTLRASQALFAASQSVERDEWKIFARSLDIQTTYPGINGIGFIRYVPNSRKAAYERQVRQDTSIDPKGYPDFAIKPAGDRSDYFVIEYIEPLALNRPAMGLDVGGDPVRRAAVMRARDTGEAAATKRIILVQDATKKPGLLILLPVYRHNIPHNTVEEKRRALLGFVYAPLRTTSLIEEALPEVRQQELDLKIYNGKDLMYASDREKNSKAIGLHQKTTLDVAGETWQLYFTSQQASRAFWKPTPILVLAGGTVISFLIFGIMRSLASSRRRALQLATAMTAELRKANAELKTEITERKRVEEELTATTTLQNAILDSANYTIISTTVDGTILTFNTAAERWLGYTASETIAKATPAIIHDTDEVVQRAKELSEEMGVSIEPGFEVFVAKARLGESDEREWTYICKDGSRFPVMLSVTALYDAQMNLTGFLGIGSNISERKQAEIALRQSEERYRAIVEDQTEAIARFDIDGKLTFVNQAYCRYFGMKQEQLIGTNFQDFVVLEEREALARHLDALILDNPFNTIECRVVVNGQVRYLQWINRVIFDEQGNFFEFQAVGQDISDRISTEAALRESERRFRAIFNSMFQFIGLLKPDGTLLEANQTALDFAGISADEAIGRPFWEARWWTISSGTQDKLKEAIASAALGEFIRYEVEVLGAGDRVTTIDFSLKPVKDETGKVVLLIPEGRDLSDRKQTEQALQESESTLRSFFDSAAIMMGIVEVFEGDILHVSDNAATAEFFGVTPEAMRGQFATQMGASQEQVQMWLARYRESELSNSPVRFEYCHNTETNSAWLAATVCAIAPMPNGRSRFSYIVEDITERKHSEEKIAESLTEKEVLLKEIHHRVKNNLQVICSLLNLQARSLKDATITALFKETQNRVRSMALVHEKLYQSNNISRIELAEYLQDIATNLSFSYPVDRSKISFKIEIQSNIFLNIDTAVPCGLIVNELISNALKYAFSPGEKGEIALRAWLNEEQNLVLNVQDNGQGFPDDFELETSKTLGLKLVKTLTYQLRGNLELERSRGTNFKILLSQIER